MIPHFLHELKQRKLAQWAFAYLAGAWLLLQVLDLLGQNFDWPPMLFRIAAIVLGIGFFAALVVAWYHGEQGRQRVSSAELMMLAALFVIAGAAVAFIVGRKPAAQSGADPSEATTSQASIAVLPFVDMSPGRDQEYFSDGITEEILNALAQVEGLRVAARTSAFQFKGTSPDVRDVGQKLGVMHVLEGSVQRAGEQLRITAQLIDARTGYHVWSAKYDRPAQDIFAVEDEISRVITNQLRLRLTDVQGRALVRAPTEDLQAHDLLLRASYEYRKNTESGLRASIELAQAALARDSLLAPAWVRISGAWAWLTDDWVAPREAYPNAKAAALKAIAADPDYADGHSQLGVVHYLYDWDFAAAQRELRRAYELDPGIAQYDQAELYIITGRLDSAIVLMQRDRIVNPLDASSATRLGDYLAWAYGRYDEAMVEYERALKLAPRYARALIGQAIVLTAQHRPEQALALLATAPEMGARLQVARAMALAAAGRRDEAAAIAHQLEEESRRRYVRAEGIAAIYGALGDRNTAFDWLERAYRERSAGLVFMASDLRFAPLRADPRWQKLLLRIRKGA